MKYIVTIPEVHLSRWTVEADGRESAIERIINYGDLITVEFSHAMDTDSWDVEEID